jgi:hypothetical protein
MNLKCINKSTIPLSYPAPPVIKERRHGGLGGLLRAVAALVAVVVSVERAAIGWMSRNGLAALRIGLGVVYVWFGALKLYPTLSPAEELVADTLRFLDPHWLLPSLGIGEIAIGLSLMFGVLMRVSLPLLFMHMAGTVLPLVLLPHTTWTRFPFAPTLEGQYIVKNIVIVGAAFVLGGKMRWRSLDVDSRTWLEASPPSGNGMRIR